MYIQVNKENNEFPFDPNQLRSKYPNVSFPRQITDDILLQYNVYKVEYEALPEFNSRTHYCVHAETPIYEDGKWLIKYTLVEKDEGAITAYDSHKAIDIRATRDKHLIDSDWVVLRAYESGESISEIWKTYRQNLRDIPLQPNFPYDIVWPTKPGDL